MFALAFRDVCRCGVLLLCVVLTAGLVGCMPARPVTAEATLHVSAGLPGMRADDDSGSADIASLLPKVHSEVRALLADPVLADLLASDEVRETGWFQQFDGDRAAVRRDAEAHVLAAAPVPDTALIRLSATAESEEDALVLLRKWIRVYFVRYENRAVNLYNQDRIAFQRQYEEVLAQIELIEARIRNHLRDHPQSAMAQRIDAATQELLFLNAKKSEITELLSAAQASYNQMLSRAEDGDFEPTAEELRIINDSRALQQLDGEVEAARQRREAALAAGNDETGPVVMSIDSQIRQLELEREQALDNQARALFNAKVELGAQAVAIYQAQLATFEPRIEELQAMIEGFQRAQAEYELLRRNREHLESQRAEARAKLRELDILIRRAGGVTVELASPPTIVEP
ncbi:hypothetical protein OT109_07510 [Phycisphaeraceae bacterium D3-23]